MALVGKDSPGHVPLYLQIATTLRRRIETGHWTSGSRISTIDELQSEFKVARVTARQALEMLEREGLLRCRQGKGTFVADDLKERRWLKVATTWRAQLETIEDVVPHFIDVEAPPRLPRLGPDEGSLAPAYAFLRSVQSRGGQPYAVVNLHLAKHIYERERRAFRARAAMQVLVDMPTVSIASARQTLVIGRADAETAHLLRTAVDAPTGEARWTILDAENVAIYVADITYRGDLIKLEIDLPAPAAHRSSRAQRRIR
jgi:GntR family transcriptional regulator